MDRFSPFEDPAALDEALLDVATLIELSPRDRQVAENRFRILKTHLERGASAIGMYLVDGESRIYAQGSVATSTTIVDGTGDDRFDVDAIVEIDVPADKDEHWALDILEESLQGFPGVTEILRCTRCVQLRFPFMHMDVTVMDRTQKLAIERAGEIFHSPDEGPGNRVPSNPWGFTKWFRGKVGIGQNEFTETLKRHRAFGSRNRLTLLAEDREILAKATQHPLPPAIPSALDAQEAVALKLLKRYLNVHYEKKLIKRPPSIYLTKRAGDVGFVNMGLTVQLWRLANSTAQIMRSHLANGTRPAEVNPSYHPDVINDRWPRAGKDGTVDMTTFAESLEHLADRLLHMASAELSAVANIVDELFGERIGRESRTLLVERYDRRETNAPVLSGVRSGAIASPAIVHASAKAQEVPRHNFHASKIDGSANGDWKK
jgi:hypothetical protein